MPPGLPNVPENWRRWFPPKPSVPPTPPSDGAGPGAAARQNIETPVEIPELKERPEPAGSKEALPREGPSSPPWPWPANNGFDGEARTETLVPGTKVDRYGNPTGKYLSPQGTPFEQRSLPEAVRERPLNVYEVVKPFEVKAGKIAPYADQPGGGTQYYLDNKTVQDLIDSGHLRKLP